MITDRFHICSVCLGPLSMQDVSALHCGHTFHFECVSKSIEISGYCPKCRKPSTFSDIIKRLYFDSEGLVIDDKPSDNDKRSREFRTKLSDFAARFGELRSLYLGSQEDLQFHKDQICYMDGLFKNMKNERDHFALQLQLQQSFFSNVIRELKTKYLGNVEEHIPTTSSANTVGVQPSIDPSAAINICSYAFSHPTSLTRDISVIRRNDAFDGAHWQSSALGQFSKGSFPMILQRDDFQVLQYVPPAFMDHSYNTPHIALYEVPASVSGNLSSNAMPNTALSGSYPHFHNGQHLHTFPSQHVMDINSGVNEQSNNFNGVFLNSF